MLQPPGIYVVTLEKKSWSLSKVIIPKLSPKPEPSSISSKMKKMPNNSGYSRYFRQALKVLSLLWKQECICLVSVLICLLVISGCGQKEEPSAITFAVGGAPAELDFWQI